MKDGFVYGIPYADYAGVDALNYSTLKHMMRSPLAYRWHRDNPQPPTPAMLLGSVTHSVILEPQRVGELAIWGAAEGENVRRGRVWEAFQEANAGKTIITADESELIVGMSLAVRRNPHAAAYLSGGDAEVSAFWTDRATGRRFKCRFDYLPRERHEFTDVKTTRDARPFRFGNESFRLGYYLQFAMYADCYYHLRGELPDVRVVAVESKPPHETVVYRVPAEVIQQGHDDYARLVQRLTECEASGIWPSEYEDEQELSLPSYAYGDVGDDLSDLQLVAM